MRRIKWMLMQVYINRIDGWAREMKIGSDRNVTKRRVNERICCTMEIKVQHERKA